VKESMQGPADPKRRATLKWMGVVMLAAGALGEFASAGQGHRRGEAAGYGMDPNLGMPTRDPWPLTLTSRQRATAAAVLDVILPQDAAAPAASAVGLVDFLDEWVSAPYPEQRSDSSQIVPLLDDIGREATQRFAKDAAALAPAEIDRLVADVARTPAFRRLCVLAAAAYYTCPAGFAAIGFVGNEPRTRFDGPPAEVLAGFEQKIPRPAAD
jgi:hypothetical protein